MSEPSDSNRWSLPLRIIHALLAAAVSAQLLVGSLMRSPHPGRADTFGFMTHELLGALILVLVVVHWGWSIGHPGEGLKHLFPWTRDGLKRVASELARMAARRELPAGGPQDRGLAGFVHGLGLLAVTATVVVGALFFVARAAGADRAALERIEDLHDVLAIVTWVYWGGHLAATVLHGLLRQPVWRRMFGFGRESRR